MRYDETVNEGGASLGGAAARSLSPWSGRQVANATNRVREFLLAGSALAGAWMLLAALSPEDAAAQCATMVGSLSCTGNFSTSDTTNNLAVPASAAREQQPQEPGDESFSASVVSGAKISGFGFAVNNLLPGGGINFTNLGSISLTIGTPTHGIEGGPAALNLIVTPGGTISYTGNGTISSLIAGTSGITATSSTGNITIAPSGQVQGAFAAISTLTDGIVEINNSGLLQNSSRAPDSLAINTDNHSAGGGNVTINNFGKVIGTVSLSAGSDTFNNNGIWNTSGTSSFFGTSALNNSGSINVTGVTTMQGLQSLTNSSSGTLTINDNASFSIPAIAIANAGIVTNNGTVNTDVTNLAAGTINNSGTWNGALTNFGTVTNDGTWNGNITNSGNLFLGSNSVNNVPILINQPGGTFQVGGGVVGANVAINGSINNAGTISFTAPSQILTTTGFSSSPGSTLVVFGNASRGTVDLLKVNGQSNGTVALNLSGVTGTGTLTPATVIQSQGGSLQVTPVNLPAGLTLGQLSPGTFALISTPSVVAAATINRSTTQITQTVNVGIEQHMQQVRDQIDYRRRLGRNAPNPPLGYADDDDNLMSYASTQGRGATAPPIFLKARRAAPPPAAPPSYGGWLQGFGDSDSRTVPGFEHRTDTGGVLGGLDKTWYSLDSSDDALVVGLVSNYATAKVSYRDSNDLRVDINGPGVGAYSTYLKGPFSMDMTAKVDFFHISETATSIIPNSVTLNNYSVAGNAQYKFDITKSSFFEPTVGFVYTNSQYGTASVPAVNNNGFINGYDMRVQGGGRLSNSFDWNNVHYTPNIEAIAYSDVKITGTTLQNIGIVAPSDEGKVRWEIDGVLDMDYGRGFSSYVRGEIRFGEDLFAYAIKGGLRYQW
jgi:hypothetical protein